MTQSVWKVRWLHRVAVSGGWVSHEPTPLTLRVSAGVHVPERGALGCTQSHIKVLQRFLADPSLKHALIMEDDVEFAYDPRPAVTRFLRDYGDHGWDAIMLAANGKLTLPHNEYLDKLVLAYTTAAYAITRDTAVKLLPIFIESERRLKIAMSYNNALDKLWEAEQVNGDWYTFVPKLATQRKSYSDVEKFVVTYGV